MTLYKYSFIISTVIAKYMTGDFHYIKLQKTYL